MTLPKSTNQTAMVDGIIHTQYQHGKHQFGIIHHYTVISQCGGKGRNHRIVATGAWYVEGAGGGVQRSTNVGY